MSSNLALRNDLASVGIGSEPLDNRGPVEWPITGGLEPANANNAALVVLEAEEDIRVDARVRCIGTRVSPVELHKQLIRIFLNFKIKRK
jgi:hypothetical protein